MRSLPLLLLLAGCSVPADAGPDRPAVRTTALQPAFATEPVPQDGDAADDPAIWHHPTDPQRSLLLGTNKRGGLDVYDTSGRRLHTLACGGHPNNVDLRHEVLLAGRTRDFALVTIRGERQGIVGFTLAPDGTLTQSGEPVAVLGGSEPYGCCLWRRASDGTLFGFVTAKDGTVEQLRLDLDAAGQLIAEPVRRLTFAGQVEGCVADDEHGWLFVSEETRAIWRVDAEPDAPDGPDLRVAVLHAGPGGFTPDAEGLELLGDANGGGFLLASIQGENRIYVFERMAPHRLLARVNLAASSKLDATEETDGLCASAWPFGANAAGVLVAQDGQDAGTGRQCFKIFDLRDCDEIMRIVDPAHPRRAIWRRSSGNATPR